MGQKVHPGGMRVGVIHDWKSNWWTGKKDFPKFLIEDIKIREHIYKKLAHAGLSDILIKKDQQRITVDIYTARPGIVIGKSGVEVDALRKELHAMTGKNVHININEIKRPELDARLVAQSIAEQLQNRVSFRRAMKRALASAIRSGAAGVRIQCGGRLGGSEMSRSESYSEGLGPVRKRRPGGGGGAGGGGGRPGGGRGRSGARPAGSGGGGGGGGGRSRSGGGQQQDRPAPNVEQPRTDDAGVSAEGREQPVIEPQVETTPKEVAEAPDTTTPKKQTEDLTKLDESGGEG